MTRALLIAAHAALAVSLALGVWWVVDMAGG